MSIVIGQGIFRQWNFTLNQLTKQVQLSYAISMQNLPILDVQIPGFCPLKIGKVRSLYELNSLYLLVTSDRISAFDYILPQAIPQKGTILTQISAFWFKQTRHIIENHVVSTLLTDLPQALQAHSLMLNGRFMLVKKTIPIKIECIVRGYLAGSGWKEYQANQHVCGIKLPKDLQKGSKLPQPIFTPSTKPDQGHDENITLEQAIDIAGEKTVQIIKEKSLALYTYAHDLALTKGIIIADTKFEFGILGNNIILIDEALTPDSSRFWPANDYHIGYEQPSFDKQFVRDYLESIHWDKQPPVPNLPEDIITKTSNKYSEVYEMLVCS